MYLAMKDSKNRSKSTAMNNHKDYMNRTINDYKDRIDYQHMATSDIKTYSTKLEAQEQDLMARLQ